MRFLWISCAFLCFKLFAQGNLETSVDDTTITISEYKSYVAHFNVIDENNFRAAIASADGNVLSTFENCIKETEIPLTVICEKEGENFELIFEVDYYFGIWTKDASITFFVAEEGKSLPNLDFEQAAPHQMQIKKISLGDKDEYKITIFGFDFDVEHFDTCTETKSSNDKECADITIECFNFDKVASELKIVAKANNDCLSYDVNARWISPANVLGEVLFVAKEVPLSVTKNHHIDKFKKALRARMQSIVDAAKRALAH